MRATRRFSWLVFAGVAVLVVAHASIAMFSTAQRSLTVDEIYHITGGYLYDRFGDYRIHPDNGVLPQRLHGLPAALSGAKPPPMTGNEYWRTSDVNVVSYQFFYESGNDHWPLLIGARALNLLFSVGICVLVFAWARALAGNVAGSVALGLAAFSPTLLAHGPLATTDASAALALTASVGAFWWQLQAINWWRTLLSAVLFGLACVTKFSAVLLIPIFLILVAIHALKNSPAGRQPARIAGGIAVHAAVAWLVIWACFGFRYSAFAPDLPPADHFIRSWDWMLAQVGWQGAVIGWIRDLELLPEAFLFGYTHTYAGSLTRAAFLAGEYSNSGWLSFFPCTFLWKSTPAELAGVVIVAVLAALRPRQAGEWLHRLAPLVVLVLVYGGVALTSNLNIGHRHLLPIYPALFIAIGIAVSRLKPARLVGGTGLALQVISAALIFPFYIAYFNPIAGGPQNGWRLLVDSSLDWGQDLGGLAAWLRRNNAGPDAQPVFLSYFGSAEPSYYRLPATRMLFVNGFKLPLRWYEPTGGIYAISATMLQEVYSPVRGPWTAEFERDYQELRKFETQFRQFQDSPAAREPLLAVVPAEQWERARHRHELLRHARLCAYLRARGPDAMVGYSILIFRVSDAEIDVALRSSYSTWQRAIETAASRGPR